MQYMVMPQLLSTQNAISSPHVHIYNRGRATRMLRPASLQHLSLSRSNLSRGSSQFQLSSQPYRIALATSF